MHTDYKDILKSDHLVATKNAMCFDPSKVKISDFKCDSTIPALTEDTKRALIMTLEYNVRKNNSSRRDYDREDCDDI